MLAGPVALIGSALVLLSLVGCADSSSGETTDLYDAVASGDDAEVVRLIEEGAPVDEEAECATALGRAVQTGSIEIVETLLEQGADPARIGDCGTTPLIVLALYVRSEPQRDAQVATLLIESGANPCILSRATGTEGSTSREIAESGGKELLAATLDRLGAC